MLNASCHVLYILIKSAAGIASLQQVNHLPMTGLIAQRMSIFEISVPKTNTLDTIIHKRVITKSHLDLDGWHCCGTSTVLMQQAQTLGLG